MCVLKLITLCIIRFVYKLFFFSFFFLSLFFIMLQKCGIEGVVKKEAEHLQTRISLILE